MASSNRKGDDIMNRIAVAIVLIATACRPVSASSGLPSHLVIAGANEPGQRLIVTGRVVGADGKPRGGVIIEAHHTDNNGIYLAEGARGPNPDVAARLFGRLATAADGTYRIDTIRPRGYPGGGAPAHIHIRIRNGRDEHWEMLEFADDRNLTPAMRAKDSTGGTFATIQPVTRDASG